MKNDIRINSNEGYELANIYWDNENNKYMVGIYSTLDVERLIELTEQIKRLTDYKNAELR